MNNHVWSKQDVNAAVAYLGQKIRAGFEDWDTLGRISVRENGKLMLFNYTRQAHYEGAFSAIEVACRGLVLEKDSGEVIARPYDKFFNWGERGLYAPDDAYITRVTSKIDGSLIIGFWYDDVFQVMTKGTFDSPQAELAREIIHKYRGMGYGDLPAYTTVMFELVHPDNRIVVNYGDLQALFLLGMRHNETGNYAPTTLVDDCADRWNMDRPLAFDLHHQDDIRDMCNTLGPNVEGFVAEFSDGSFWKFKNPEYLELSKYVNGFSIKKVVRAIREGKSDDFEAVLPSHMRKEYRRLQDQILDNCVKIYNAAFNIWDNGPGPRPELAKFVMGNSEYKKYAPYIFAIDDNKIREEVYDMILDREY